MPSISPTGFNQLLREKKLTIFCAESITAGLLASTIASVSGASDVLLGSIVTYSRKVKSAVLGVDPRVIDKNTAESMETTVEMVYGLVKLYPAADIHVAVTGLASKPGKNYPANKKTGQVYVAIYCRSKLHKKEKVFKSTDRNTIRESTVSFILDAVAKIITANNV